MDESFAWYVGLEDDSLSGSLQQGCPSYFREDDKVYYAANGELRRAQTLQGAQRQDITRAALDKLVRVSLVHATPLPSHRTSLSCCFLLRVMYRL